MFINCYVRTLSFFVSRKILQPAQYLQQYAHAYKNKTITNLHIKRKSLNHEINSLTIHNNVNYLNVQVGEFPSKKRENLEFKIDKRRKFNN